METQNTVNAFAGLALPAALQRALSGVGSEL